jgi:hypothetical protein
VLPPKLPRIAVEAGVTDGWWKYGCAAVIGIDRYGERPGGVLFKHFGFTAENVADRAKSAFEVTRQVTLRFRGRCTHRPRDGFLVFSLSRRSS